MARPKKTAGIGHNVALSEDERIALKAYFAQKIRAQRRVVAQAAEELKTERDGLNGLFSNARGDLGITRQDFEDDLRMQDMSDAEYRAYEAARTQRHKESGLKVGEQGELALGDTADDKASAYESGHRAGLRGDDGVCPDSIAPILRADWEHGWADGQAKLAERLTTAAGVLERIKATKPELEPEEEPEEDLDQIDIEEGLDKAARDLKRSGWTEPTAEERELEEADA